MSKLDVLRYLAKVDAADSTEAAEALGLSYAAAAMALLRLVRQGLVIRYLEPDRGTYWYELTEHGHERLAYLSDLD